MAKVGNFLQTPCPGLFQRVLELGKRCSKKMNQSSNNSMEFGCSNFFWSWGVWLAIASSSLEFGSRAMPNNPLVSNDFKGWHRGQQQHVWQHRRWQQHRRSVARYFIILLIDYHHRFVTNGAQYRQHFYQWYILNLYWRFYEPQCERLVKINIFHQHYL